MDIGLKAALDAIDARREASDEMFARWLAVIAHSDAQAHRDLDAELNVQSERYRFDDEEADPGRAHRTRLVALMSGKLRNES